MRMAVRKSRRNLPLWRGDLSPLGCEAAPNQTPYFARYTAGTGFAAAAQPSGDKSPRHRGGACVLQVGCGCRDRLL
ncbi:hypothetical protein C1C98_17115 [Pseudomonas ogarae]|uniref:DUF1534 domain-containing protein n=1 Tax=Pseudomonas ogarae (strain DSM 112162 / CECT 30235 / F113) TaxID=1114970 RepID=A0ABN5GE63_PSEO1|nr:hypothetical protein C1C98_17115 [Pseudomonas ogarae]